jgi:HAD superfamily hydrolase (TIGR01549 family)
LGTTAVLFDLGSTLATPWVLELTFQRILAFLEIDISLEGVGKVVAKTEKLLHAPEHASLYGKASCDEYWNLWRSLVVKNLGLHENVRLVEEIKARWHSYMECDAYPEVKETLRLLRERGLRIGLISAAYVKDVDAILEKANIRRESFDVIVGADTAARVKPHPEAFKYALGRLGAQSEEAIFVGNSIETDYEAAERAGIKAILIHRSENADTTLHGLRVIGRLDEVFKYLC